MRELATSPASASPSDVLDDHGRRSRGEARAAEERARACDEIPGFDAALATGAVSAGHIWVDKKHRVWRLHIELDPERRAKLAATLQAQLDTVQQRDGHTGVDIDRLRADASCELVTLTAGDIDKRVPEVHVHIAWHTLSTGEYSHSLCEQSELYGRVVLRRSRRSTLVVRTPADFEP